MCKINDELAPFSRHPIYGFLKKLVKRLVRELSNPPEEGAGDAGGAATGGAATGGGDGAGGAAVVTPHKDKSGHTSVSTGTPLGR